MTIREFFEEAEKIAGASNPMQRVNVNVSRPMGNSQPKYEYSCNAPNDRSMGGTEFHSTPEAALAELKEIVARRVETEMELSPTL